MSRFVSEDPTVLESATRESLACPGSLAARGGLGELPYVCEATTEACSGKASSLSQWSRKSRWTGTRSSDETLVFSLREHCMINYLEIDSNTVGSIEVFTAAVNRRGRYAMARPRMVLPQGRKFRGRLGFLPCKFIKLVCCNTNARPGLSIFSVRIVGMKSSGVQLGLGPRMHNMLMTTVERNIYTTKEVAALDEADPESYDTISEINVESEADSLQDNNNNNNMKDATQRLIEQIVEEETKGAHEQDFANASIKGLREPQRISVQARIPSSSDAAFVASAVSRASVTARTEHSLANESGPFVTSYSSRSPSRKKPRSRRRRPGRLPKRGAAGKISGWQSWGARGKAAVEGSRMRQAQMQGQRSSRLGIHAHLKAIYGGNDMRRSHARARGLIGWREAPCDTKRRVVTRNHYFLFSLYAHVRFVCINFRIS